MLFTTNTIRYKILVQLFKFMRCYINCYWCIPSGHMLHVGVHIFDDDF